MHIMEGFLPTPWWQIWFAVSIPVILYGIHKLNRLVKEKREILPLLAVAGAFIFVLSSLKLPSVTGSCSHPTGTGIAAIMFGPAITAVLSTIVLIYQALFLAHGGLTTLGANVFSMGIVGPVVSYLIYKAGMKAKINFLFCCFSGCSFWRLGYLHCDFYAACPGISCRRSTYLWSFPQFIRQICCSLCIYPGASGNHGRCCQCPALQVCG